MIGTDKLKSYDAAKREILPHVEHRQSEYLNNRIELSYQPTGKLALSRRWSAPTKVTA